MRPGSPRYLGFVLLPAAVLLTVFWRHSSALETRARELALEARQLRAELAAAGHEGSALRIEARREQVEAESEALRGLTAAAERLGENPQVRERSAAPFRLIEFERERATVAAELKDRAAAAGVKLDASAFGVLADASENGAGARRRWAQLALAREVANRAVAAKVASYEALPVPAVREIRAGRDLPLLAEEILFTARVSGPGARVQDFVELLALGAAPGDPPLVIEHVVLRKDGVEQPDLASATVVVAALLAPEPSAPAAQ